MDIIFNLLKIVLGFVLLIKGADFFVDGASAVALKLGVPQLVIGLTIVAFGTSAPEAAVSISAGLQGNIAAISNKFKYDGGSLETRAYYDYDDHPWKQYTEYTSYSWCYLCNPYSKGKAISS